MQLQYLNKFLNDNYIDTGINCIFYNFEQGNTSGFFVKNLINSGEDQYGEIDGDKYILQDYYPGYLTNCYDKNYRYTGMAYFEGNDRLKVSKDLSSENFNLMLNIKSYGCNPDYIDIDVEDLTKPSGIFLNDEFYPRISYADGIKFTKTTRSVIFNRSGQFGDYGDWYHSAGSFVGPIRRLISEGIASKLPKDLTVVSKIASVSSEFLLGKAQSLINLRSKNDSNYPFDLKVAITNNYKIMFEFSGIYSGNSITFNKVCTGELGNQSIVSLNGYGNTISVCYHDFLANRNNCESINTTYNFLNQPKEIYIGNNFSGYNGDYYTGYRGLLSDVLLFTGKFLNPITELSLSKLFIKTGEHTGSQAVIETSYNLLSSGYLTTGYIGTGITGYELVETEQVTNCTDNCIFYVKSGITGLLTGEVIQYQLVQSASTSYIESGITIEDYDSGNANIFAKNYLVLYKPIDNKDFIEVQTYELFDNLRSTTYSLGGNIYTSETNLDNNKNLVFFNGVDIMSGYYQINDIKKLIIDTYKADYKDNVFYKQFPVNSFEYKFDYTGQNQVLGISTPSDTLNLFLNGQKLINNYNYEYVYFPYPNGNLLYNGNNLTYYGDNLTITSYIVLNNSTLLTTGEIYILEDNAVKYTTGSNTGFFDLKPNYGSDMVWFNGILQKEFDDYILLSCNNDTIQDYQQKSFKEQPIYISEFYRFNAM
jgi:hypothetical protein